MYKDVKNKMVNKGYIEETNCILTNRKFKNFKYLDNEENIKEIPSLNFNTEIKLNSLDFYRVIEYFDKINKSAILLDFEDKYQLILKDIDNLINIKIPLIDFNGEIEKSNYSIEYLKAFFKEYKIKELKEEFIILKFSNDYPLKIELNKDWLILAPRIIN